AFVTLGPSPPRDVGWPGVWVGRAVRKQRALRTRAPPADGPARDGGGHDPEPTVPLARRPGMKGDPAEPVQLGGSGDLRRTTLDEHTPSGLCGVVYAIDLERHDLVAVEPAQHGAVCGAHDDRLLVDGVVHGQHLGPTVPHEADAPDRLAGHQPPADIPIQIVHPDRGSCFLTHGVPLRIVIPVPRSVVTPSGSSRLVELSRAEG